MKKSFTSIFVILSLLLMMSGCADNKVIQNKEYETYGFMNEDELKNRNIKYSVSVGNIIWGVLLIETIIAPIYFFGYSLYEPDHKIAKWEDNPDKTGIVD